VLATSRGRPSTRYRADRCCHLISSRCNEMNSFRNRSFWLPCSHA
jgi:hypothetical protein